MIEAGRAGEIETPEGSAAQVIASHRDADGTLLPPAVAAVELINVLRPTVAVARFVTFAALALHDYPKYRQRMEAGGDAELEQEAAGMRLRMAHLVHQFT